MLNAGLVKFHLINNYGAREKEKVEVSGRSANTLFIRNIIKKSLDVDDESD